MTHLGRYQIVGLLGQGGMGAVHRAIDPVMERTVAIKTILGGAFSPEQGERFLREIRAGGRLSHKNIVVSHDAGQDNGTVYIVMEFIDGGDLGNLLKSGRIPAQRVLEILSAIAEALDYAHSKDIVHRDIKPANIICGVDGCVKLADFGIAKLLYKESITPRNGALGTAHYIAPEIWKGQRETGHCDQFSLGVVAYEALVGCLPFQGENVYALSMRIMSDEPPPSASLSKEIDSVLERVLSKDPPRRYQKCSDFVRDLAAALDAPRKEEERMAREAAAREVAARKAEQERLIRAAQERLAELEAQLLEAARKEERITRQAAEREAAARKAEEERELLRGRLLEAARKEEERYSREVEDRHKTNLDRWRSSGEPEAWVRAHVTGWNHQDWLAILASLCKSQYWPMNEAAIGQHLETLLAKLRKEEKDQIAWETSVLKAEQERQHRPLMEGLSSEAAAPAVQKDRLKPDFTDALKSLDQQVESVNDLAELKPLFLQLEEFAIRANDFEVHLAIGDIKQHLVNRGYKLKQMKLKQAAREPAPKAVPSRGIAHSAKGKAEGSPSDDRRNKYREALAQWKALPLLRRRLTKKPPLPPGMLS